MLDAFQLALQELLSNLFRSILSILGIAVGIVALISMMSLNEGTQRQILNDITRIGGADIIKIGTSRKNIYTIDVKSGRPLNKYPLKYDLFPEFKEAFPDISAIPITYLSNQLRLPVTGYRLPVS